MGALANNRGKGSIDFTDRAGVDDLDLQPEGGAASRTPRNVTSVFTALIGLTSTPTRTALGTSSCRSDSTLDGAADCRGEGEANATKRPGGGSSPLFQTDAVRPDDRAPFFDLALKERA
jgi:hypothetical protein